MEKKRKLPARAAARAEAQVKKRNITPRRRSPTPPPPPPEEPVEEAPPPPPPLPKSVEAGQPLPVIEDPQPDDLSAEDYQSVTESGVLAESLTRSRHKWIHEGLFEKYWTKPFKRKGVLQEDPKNPPKDSMTKVGHVTINIEPHIIEATMYVVKAPKPPPGQQPQPQPQQSPAAAHPRAAAQPPQPAPSRPVLQYGPPNGSMPPQKSQSPAVASPSTPVAAAAQLQSAEANAVQTGASQPAAQQVAASSRPAPHIPAQAATIKTESPGPLPATASPSPARNTLPNLAPPATSAVVAPASGSVQPAAAPTQASHAPLPPRSGLSMPPGFSSTPPPVAGPSSGAGPSTAAARPPAVTNPNAPPPAARPATQGPKSAASDPVIALLAQKASGDAGLRDLMKRVAMGQAKPGELSHFQQIIDQLNQEYKRSGGGQQGPTADRLLVDGKTVKWFAGEVRTILDIVLASNPNQKSSELKPPPRSDPLVVMLVKTALDDQRTRDIIRRIAEDRPGPYDAQALKDTLDRLHQSARAAALQAPVPQGKPAAPSGQPHGQQKTQTHHQPDQANPQPLRSKAPAPAPKPDITAVVFDFGTGDRYLFPKYSILDTLTTPSGQQVVASFLIVRKGSTSEYGGDPKLDYYQPVTIRLQTQSGRQLENLMRVVAPVEEVRRYMDDVMDNMTRAEYVLLAMRLPRRLPDENKADGSGDAGKSKTTTPITRQSVEPAAPPARPSVLWTSAAASKSASGSPAQTPMRMIDPEEETELKYQRLIQAVTAKDVVHV